MSATRRERLREVVREALADREASAFVAVGSGSEPGIRYCLFGSRRPDETGSDDPVARTGEERETRAIAVTADAVFECGPAADGTHPARTLASRLAGEGLAPETETGADAGARTLLTPRTIPHDAALYLEGAGFDLASSDVLERARARKTADERERLERAQAAASAGLERAATVLAAAAVVGDSDGGDDDRTLEYEGEPLTPERVRIAIDEAVVRAGAYPVGATAVRGGARRLAGDDPLRAGEPIALETAPRDPDGYRGGLVRTVVVDGEGGPERRAHVAITHAFKSARALCSTEDPTIEAVEGDLEAEIRAFGFSDGADGERIETAVRGVGLEPSEGPVTGRIPDGAVVRLEAAVTVDGTTVRLADPLVRTESGSGSGSSSGARWLAELERSLEPSAYR